MITVTINDNVIKLSTFFTFKTFSSSDDAVWERELGVYESDRPLLISKQTRFQLTRDIGCMQSWKATSTDQKEL
jgi:hypothetical protein